MDLDVGSGLTGVLPVSTSMPPSVWLLIAWCSDRISANFFASLACRGNNSQMLMPGTVVAIGLKRLRYSLGAAAFKS